MNRKLFYLLLIPIIFILPSCAAATEAAASFSRTPAPTVSASEPSPSPSPEPSPVQTTPPEPHVPTPSPSPKPSPTPSTVPAGIVRDSGVVIGTNVAFRSEPDTDSKIIARLNRGDYVQIIKTNVDAQWHQVKYDGKTGYVNRVFICLDPSLDGYKLDYVATVVNCQNNVNVRKAPSKDSEIIGVAKKGDKLTIIPQDTYIDNWYQVEYNGQTGYIHADYLDIEAKADDTQLTNLTVTGGPIYPSFSPKEYGYVVKASQSKVTIEARANAGVNVNINNSGKKRLTVEIPSTGMKTVRIAINGVIRYSLYISRNILTVGTWNIKRGDGHLLMQGRLIYDQQPDIMGIQEAFQNLKADNIIDNLASLKTKNMSNCLFSPTINYSNGSKYGNGLISRYKLRDVKTYSLYSGGYEKRLLQKAVATIGGKTVSLYNTHFTYNTASVRVKQFEQVKKIMDEDPNKYKILTGDFNAGYGEFSLFLKNYKVINSPDTKYYDYSKKEIEYSELDNIIVTKNIDVINSRIIVTKLSDHYPVFAYLVLK